MSNYKVKVNNEAESREVQGLFFELGYHWYYNGKQRIENVTGFINSSEDMSLTSGSIINGNNKELTIPQLKDLVVLKRNDVSDKTHYCNTTNSNYFVSSDNVVYFFNNEKNNTWQKSNYDLSELKPINKPLKEYLVPQDNGKYALTKATEKLVSDWVEVPDGMNFAHKDEFNIHFTKLEMGYRDSIIVWQRHTQPEELPFVDDEPKSLNDTYAEIEQVRHNHYFKDVSDVNQIDVYEVLKRFNVTDPCLQHIVKKALCAGQRGHKDLKNDLQDILDTAKRAVEINK